MRKFLIFPKLGISGIMKNTKIYLPYLLTCAFSAAIYFIFGAIADNKLVETVPHAGYMMMLLMIGKVLLAIILVPFLFYTNSFLIKRRNKELALYGILGLEKKHIAILLFSETIVLFTASVVIGIAVALLFGNLIFAVLLNISGLPIDTRFTVSRNSVYTTILLMLFVHGMNLVVNMFHVTIANPMQLLQKGKKGEKEPKHLWVLTLIGLLLLGSGYTLSVKARLDSMIFIFFFLAVLLVSVGTYFLFTSGSIALLRILQKNKNFYYKSRNYVTISGMIYRMKKNAAGLSVICIFGTMIMVTFMCTMIVFKGQEGAIRFECPYDVLYRFTEEPTTDMKKVKTTATELAEENHVQLRDLKETTYYQFNMNEKEDKLELNATGMFTDNQHYVYALTLDDYRTLTGNAEPVSLQEDEVLMFSTNEDFGKDTLNIEGQCYHIVKEVDYIGIAAKEPRSFSKRYYFVVMKDREAMDRLAANVMGENPIVATQTIRFQLEGEQEDKETYLEVMSCVQKLPGFIETEDIINYGKRARSMNGGLLFMGIFFGIIFMMFLGLIMYYKQITEGLEDKENFQIMQNVGMSDKEVKGTIQRQILLVFFIPLVGAILHSIIGLHMVFYLLSAVNIFNIPLMAKSTVIVILGFMLVYTGIYAMTAKTYYRIVR